MSFETITADVLFQTSRKRICEVARQQFVALGQADEYDRIRRHPDTCQSRVLTLAEADELWASRLATPSLLGDIRQWPHRGDATPRRRSREELRGQDLGGCPPGVPDVHRGGPRGRRARPGFRVVAAGQWLEGAERLKT